MQVSSGIQSTFSSLPQALGDNLSGNQAPAQAAVRGDENRRVLSSPVVEQSHNEVQLSDEGKHLAQISSSLKAGAESGTESVGATPFASEPAVGDEDSTATPKEVGSEKAGDSNREKLQLNAEIRELGQRDREVRNHERIHAAVAGAHGGSPRFQFQRGPDGVLYAISGSVSIDLAPVPGNAEATVRKAEQIQRAALAPSDPSGADRAVAAKARGLATEARIEIADQSSDELNGKTVESGDDDAGSSATPDVNSSGEGSGATRLPSSDGASSISHFL